MGQLEEERGERKEEVSRALEEAMRLARAHQATLAAKVTAQVLPAALVAHVTTLDRVTWAT